MILLMPISSPWSMITSTISEEVYTASSIWCGKEFSQGLHFTGLYFIVHWNSCTLRWCRSTLSGPGLQVAL